MNRYYVECCEKYLKLGKSILDYKWVRRKRDASRLCKKTANNYVLKWKHDGARKIKIKQRN